jgi:hypothetical protein
MKSSEFALAGISSSLLLPRTTTIAYGEVSILSHVW